MESISMAQADSGLRRTPRRRRFISFHRDENGSISVEFVLWIPIFIFLIAIITDLSIVYVVNANMYDVARDTARRWSQDRNRNEFPTDQDVKDHVNDEMVLGYDTDGVKYDVNAVWNPDDDEVTVAIRAKSADVDIFGIMTPLGVEDLVAQVTMRLEP
jgi:Flp pilus assembly protein TadG